MQTAHSAVDNFAYDRHNELGISEIESKVAELVALGTLYTVIDHL